jgi:hypothetical protein
MGVISQNPNPKRPSGTAHISRKPKKMRYKNPSNELEKGLAIHPT